MAPTAFPALVSRGRALPATGPGAVAELRRSDDAAGDVAELTARLAADGYLYLPGFLDRDAVLAARRDLLTRLQAAGQVAAGTDPMAAVPGPAAGRWADQAITRESAAFQSVAYGERLAAFYRGLFGEPVRHYDYTWLRAVRPGPGTPPHGDSVFMNRGTSRLLTCWIPLGDVDLALGGLIVLGGSQDRADLRAEYHTRDVDLVCTNRAVLADGRRPGPWGADFHGYISDDPPALAADLGLRWRTSPLFRAGDIVTFPMWTLHGSLDNTSDRLRLSCDIRYQPATEPADPRWIGPNPPGHGGTSTRGLIC